MSSEDATALSTISRHRVLAFNSELSPELCGETPGSGFFVVISCPWDSKFQEQCFPTWALVEMSPLVLQPHEDEMVSSEDARGFVFTKSRYVPPGTMYLLPTVSFLLCYVERSQGGSFLVVLSCQWDSGIQ